MRLYAYCVCEPLEAGALAEERGVGGEAVRQLELGGGLAALVSEIESEAAVGVTPENVRAHNRVNARVLARTTPLPFRFGTLLAEARLAGYVEANERALREALARVGGCVEMGVKIMSAAGGDDEEEEEAARPSPVADQVGQVGQVGRGTEFLLAKRRELMGGERTRARAEEAGALLAARVSDTARETRVALLPTRALLLRAAHLVERARLAEYRVRVRALEAERARGLNFLTSGPWPPYSFSEINST
jgi:hypothetical protein